MDEYIKEILKEENFMEKEYILKEMDIFIKVNL